VTGRDRTCGAPRFRRALYRLSYGHKEMGEGWGRTSDILFVRQALSRLSYSPAKLRDKDSNLDLHVQSVVSFRLDDPGPALSSPSTVPLGRSTQQRAALRATNLLSRSTRSRTMFSEPLTCPSTLDRPPAVALTARWPSYVEELWSPTLERSWAQSVFLSQAGPRVCLDLLQAVHHLSVSFVHFCFQNEEGDPFGSPSLRAVMRLEN
jgi:hypothetical protein